MHSCMMVFVCWFAGFLIDFIPLPVISGFTSAAAITIAGGQLKVMCVRSKALLLLKFHSI